MKVLWLASWFPSDYDEQLGDFVQRHAIAVAAILPITLMHVPQVGATSATQSYQKIYQIGNLTILESAFHFIPKGFLLIDKLIYNWKYLKHYKQLLLNHIELNGMPDLVHVHVPIKAGMLAIWLKKKYKIPYIVSEQASYYESAAPDSVATRSWFFKSSLKQVLQNADAVTNVSATIGLKMMQHFHLSAVKTIHNAVDTDLFYIDESKKISTDGFRLIHVSAMGHQKNIEGLLEAFALAYQQDHSLKLVLGGPLQDHHQKLIQSLQLTDAVEVLGLLTYADVARAMQNAHAFVLFSRHENFPCVVVEALCCGLPVIASNVGGVKEAVGAEQGILVASEDVEALAIAMINMKNSYYKFHPQKIALSASKAYNYQHIADQFIQLYSQIDRKLS